jgi:hypothetical protein
VTAIPRFFLHLRRDRELIADEHGEELADAEAAYLQAFSAAQELWATALVRRDDPTIYSFEVVDDKGRLLFTLPLPEVLDATIREHRKLGTSDIQGVLAKNSGAMAPEEEQPGPLTDGLLRRWRKPE